MRLTWDTGYADYTDTANWLPRLEALRLSFSALTPQNASMLSDSALLDAMEEIEELMRYYCAVSDMQNLEPVMRRMNELLKLCKERTLDSIGAAYLEMLFLRMNAVLYRIHKQNRQSAECYQQSVGMAKRCFALLQADTALSDPQILYVGWNCVECWKEAAETNDNLLATASTKQYFLDLIPMLTWLEPYMADYYGIADKAADLYATIGGYLYLQQTPAPGAQCYQHSIDLFNRIDRRGGSDFYRARAIWALCCYGIMEFNNTGNFRIMNQCEAEASAYLQERAGATDREQAIIHSCTAMVAIQRSAVLQQNGQSAEAIRIAKPACDQLGSALDVLMDYHKKSEGYSRTVISAIAARVFGSHLGALDSLGVMYYQNGQSEEAEQAFTTALELLNYSHTFTMGESSAILIRAEICQYMALLASDAGDSYQTEFYGTQAADQALQFGLQARRPIALNIAIISCSLVAEVCLASKNKAKAGSYAQQGLDACQLLAQIDPQSLNPELQRLLEKSRRKAARKFF